MTLAWAEWQPYWPWVLALVMALVAWWGETRRVLAVRRWFHRGALERVGWRPTRRSLATVLGITVIVAGALTVARWQEAPSGALWLLIDQSRSQAAIEADGRSRWQQAQPVLQTLVAGAKRPVAIVVFRNDAAVLVPPTRDRQSVLQTLDTLQPIIDRKGSDPVAAIRLYGRLRQSHDTALLVSDGEWARTPRAASVPVVGWGLGQAAKVPPVPGDPAAAVSQPNPAALQALCEGHSLWGASVMAADLERLQRAASDSSRSWATLFLMLALFEAGLVIAQRYQVRLEQLPYRWVQRWVIWRAGTASVMVLLLLLPAASDVPAWRWRSQASAAREAYNAGCEAAGRGDRQMAEREWRRAVTLDPAWQPAWYNLGTLLAAVPGRQQEALQSLDRAMTLDPSDVWTQENRQALQAAMRAGRIPTVPSAAPATSPTSSFLDQVAPAAGNGHETEPGALLQHGGQPLTAIPSDPQGQTDPADGKPGTGSPRQGGIPDLRQVDLSRLPPSASGQPQPLPSLRPGEIDRLLGQAEALSPQSLERLQRLQQGQGQPGPLPSLTPEQWARMAALAARMGVQPQALKRQGDQASLFEEPAGKAGSDLRW